MILAFRLPSVVAGLELFWKVGPMMGIAFWMGFIWRRMTAKGAWASTLGAFLIWWVTTQPFFVSALSRSGWAGRLRMVVSEGDTSVVALPWQMILYLSAGMVAGIAASLISRPASKSKLDLYYRLVRTPVSPGEPSPGAPCTIAGGAGTPPRRELFPGSSFFVPVPSKGSLWGLAGVSAMVLALIYSVVFIVSV
jgi:hypothetical protein